MDRRTWRGVWVLVVAMLTAGTLAIAPATAGKFLTKKRALKLFYAKAAADSRFVNIDEKASDSDKLDGTDSTGFLGAGGKASDSDKLDGIDSIGFAKLGRSDSGSCNPLVFLGFAPCASVTFTLPTAGRVLLIGDVAFHSDQVSAAGNCRMTADASQVGPTIDVGVETDETGPNQQVGAGLTAVTGSLPSGPHTFLLECSESDTDINFGDATISAVLLANA